MSISAVTLAWCGVARAFVPSPSHTRAQSGRSGLVLRSTVEEEEVAAAAPTVEGVAAATDATDSMPGDSSSVSGAETAKPGMAENAKFQCEDSVEFGARFREKDSLPLRKTYRSWAISGHDLLKWDRKR